MGDGLEYLLGTQGLSAQGWEGVFYPPGTRDQLEFYSKVFPTIELNTTFYAIPRRGTVEGWKRRSSAEFVFSCKLPREITHDSYLEPGPDTLRALAWFLEVVSALEEKLGVILVQLPPGFGAEYLDRLEWFVRQLPDGFRYAVEFRNRDWDRDDVGELLQAHGVAWVLNDWRNMPPAIRFTADFTYVRWVGHHWGLRTYDRVQRDRLDDLRGWASLLQEAPRSVRKLFAYANNHYEGHAPATVRRFQEIMRLPVSDPAPHWPQQTQLFEAPEG